MEPDLEDLFVSSFIAPNHRVNVRKWLADERQGRERIRDKLAVRFAALIDPRFVVEGGAAAFEKGRRPRYHISANPSLDGRWLSEHEYRVENGGYYDALIAIVDPEHSAVYIGENGAKRVYLAR
jgi:hypothetical protein